MLELKYRFPRFVKEGYAVLKGGDFYADDGNDGLDIATGKKRGFCEKISLKPNAPLWAIDEYETICRLYSEMENSERNPNESEKDEDNSFYYENKFQ